MYCTIRALIALINLETLLANAVIINSVVLIFEYRSIGTYPILLLAFKFSDTGHYGRYS